MKKVEGLKEEEQEKEQEQKVQEEVAVAGTHHCPSSASSRKWTKSPPTSEMSPPPVCW